MASSGLDADADACTLRTSRRAARMRKEVVIGALYSLTDEIGRSSTYLF